jgi:peptidyl-tRNA hydrolase
MKEQNLIEMKNKVEALIRMLQQVMGEQRHLTTLASGTLEVVKLMPGYDEAIQVMTNKAKLQEAEMQDASKNELLN